jgi:hypothetical protein
MHDNDGSIVAHTCTGVGQGDPFSSVFFELALQPILLRLSEKVRTFERAYDVLHPESPIVRPRLVTAYEDDTSIRGEMAMMYDVAPYFAPIFEAYGFVVKVEKSFITCKDTDTMPDALEDFAISAEGIVALGVPIGSRNCTLHKTTELLFQMHPPKDALTLLTPRTGLLLLLKCFNSRPGFLMRTAVDCTILFPAAAVFDTAITDCVLPILTLPPSDKLKSPIFIPRRLGGLGFTRHDGIASEKSQLISRLSLQNFLATTYPIDFQYR